MASGSVNLISADLREDFGLALAPLAPGQVRVDRQKKILYGVRVLGLKSGNTHGVPNVTGTDYEPKAIAEALSQYEGKPGYADHPPREKPNQDRSIYDALGVHHDVRQDDGGMASNFHFVPHHELTESILDAAENEKLAGLYAFSHNASGQGEVRNGRYVITKITEARSGDIVAKGATTRSLFESAEPSTMTTPILTKLSKIILESNLAASGEGFTKANLLEMTDEMSKDVDTEGDPVDDMLAAVGKHVKKGTPEGHAMAKKIMALLKPDCAAAKDDKAATKAADSDKDVKESLALSTKILVAVGQKAEGPLLEAMNLVHDLDGKLAMLNVVKNAAAAIATPAKPGTKPPPGPAANPPATPLLEGATPKFDTVYGAQLR